MRLAQPQTETPAAAEGSTYKLVARSTEEAVKAIREQLGERARVLSVRQVNAPGLASLWTRPRLEVIAQLPAPESPAPFESTPGQPRDERPATSADALGLDRGSRFSRDQPTGLADLLRRSGFSPALIARLEAAPELAGHQGRPLHRVLVDLGLTLGAAATRRPARPLPARAAFIGTPGSGRTTALSKWLAREVFTCGRAGCVYKVELDRPNPGEGLAVFCEALGLVLEHAGDDADLALDGADFACIDTPALSVRSPRENRRLLQLLDRAGVEGRVLVLNALYDASLLRETCAAGRDLGATHVVFTHLDELGHWGRLWDFLVDGELPPLFLSTGSGLTGDIVTDVVAAVVRRTLPGAPVPHLS